MHLHFQNRLRWPDQGTDRLEEDIDVQRLGHKLVPTVAVVVLFHPLESVGVGGRDEDGNARGHARCMQLLQQLPACPTEGRRSIRSSEGWSAAICWQARGR